jgi:hypothetical protein
LALAKLQNHERQSILLLIYFLSKWDWKGILGFDFEKQGSQKYILSNKQPRIYAIESNRKYIHFSKASVSKNKLRSYYDSILNNHLWWFQYAALYEFANNILWERTAIVQFCNLFRVK